MWEWIGSVLAQVLVAVIAAVAGVVVTRWLEKGKRRVLEDKNATLEDEIREVASQPEVYNESEPEHEFAVSEDGDLAGEPEAENGSITEGQIGEVDKAPRPQKVKMTGWNWREVMPMLSEQLPAGSVSTYSLLSLRLYRRPLSSTIQRLLGGASKNGHRVLTNRIVNSDGSLANWPEPSGPQRQQLEEEGIPFTPDGKVDWTKIKPVVIT